jgi:hypothetical protein
LIDTGSCGLHVVSGAQAHRRYKLALDGKLTVERKMEQQRELKRREATGQLQELTEKKRALESDSHLRSAEITKKMLDLQRTLAM